MIDARLASLIAGIAAALLFYAVASGALPGILVSYTPMLPLLIAGLGFGAYAGLIASGLAGVLSGLLLGPSWLGAFLLLFALPCAFFAWQALRHLTIETFTLWFPVGAILTHLAYIAALLITVGTLVISASDFDPLAMLQQVVTEENADQTAKMLLFMQEWGFALAGLTVWSVLLMVYGVAVLANALLEWRGLNLRPSLRLDPFAPSMALLFALLLAGLLSFSNGAGSFLGGALFITLLFPYLLMGLARLHLAARGWKNRRLWLGMIYGSILLFQFMPLAVFIGIGLYDHCVMLSRRVNPPTSNP